MMGQVISIEEFRRQRLDRELKKRLKAAQDDLAKAYRAQRDLIDELQQARCPTCNEERILEIMERASYAMIDANGGRDGERTLPGPQGVGHELPRFPVGRLIESKAQRGCDEYAPGYGGTRD